MLFGKNDGQFAESSEKLSLVYQHREEEESRGCPFNRVIHLNYGQTVTFKQCGDDRLQ